MWVSHAAQDKIHMSSHHVLAFDVLLCARRSACRSLMPQLRNPYPALTLTSLNPAVVSLASHENNFFPMVSYCMCVMGNMQWQDLKGREQSVFSLTIPPSTRNLSCEGDSDAFFWRD
jgi:hypothetical protein